MTVVRSRETEIRNALTERVSRRVAGQGVSRRAISDAVTRVLASLPREASSAAPPATSTLSVLAVSARSIPDLGSRVRSVLFAAGVAITRLATASAGQHVVVVVELHAAAADLARHTVTGAGWRVSDVPAEST